MIRFGGIGMICSFVVTCIVGREAGIFLFIISLFQGSCVSFVVFGDSIFYLLTWKMERWKEGKKRIFAFLYVWYPNFFFLSSYFLLFLLFVCG
ncbi:hypothetical protein QBC42DRAFT_274896 [Cladorrhinum samala]|uniref:Uncharacterized protein n=1 Tax=Cladorrhinum samala TaxID=585594 RepID=A0AAV9HFH3_9PEZI|nr:hypothetical protein QBC42DRAFT_274896 [Cladorrhinum samala]